MPKINSLRVAGLAVGACALALASFVAAPPAHATTYAEEEFVCPIGGETFKALVVMSNSSFGQRPDGRAYSPLPVYPVVECPENGFLMFDEDFTEEELTVLEAAIATPEFKAMRETETQHYRVWWLKEKAGREPLSKISSLYQATWESDYDRERKIRYQAQFASAMGQFKRSEDNATSWFWLNLRAVNALRETGNFAQASQRLDLVMKPEHLPTDPDELENARYFAGEMRTLIGEENSHNEPANMVPTNIAMFRCAAPQSPLTPVEVTACESERIAKAISDFEYETQAGEKLKGKPALQAAGREWD